ncbi:MAG: arsenate reductase ArsC [Proteobacteria bacterium]|nr:arsenate reductase ArsC [Pseudomonadota bacterium]
MKKVLVICEHNSARSQMFEAFLRKFGGGGYQVESAGFEPTRINPLVIEAMKEEGIDLSLKKTQSVFELFKAGKLYDYVITVCDESVAAKCPIFPGLTHRLHLPFPDPAGFIGTEAEKLEQTLWVRDAIKQAVRDFIDDHEQFLIRTSAGGFGRTA